MSAPDTNHEKQQRRHRGPLLGIWGGLALVAVLFLGWLAFVSADAEAPEGAPAQVEGTTGRVDEAAPDPAAAQDGAPDRAEGSAPAASE
ncbi:hypothetical protein [Salipiger thiooxidans]|uniref:hypothetical protein n=1 Tax=Salipiger thiooxidans TaxID=282683 RepID=UPI001CD1ED87|nr:hypothetical protein [Salipiger thiooxidans]MCA0850997.1 hypothetical protein [Salipiger thiooxidans]